MSDDIFNNIYNKSLDLLSRREHSTKEIKEKLLLRFDDCAVIDSVLTKLEKNNLISNLRFAEAYVSSRKTKGFGPKKISFELISKIDSTFESIIFFSKASFIELFDLSNPYTFIPLDFEARAIDEPIMPRPIIRIFSTFRFIYIQGMNQNFLQ